jgi:hypothetical protein
MFGFVAAGVGLALVPRMALVPREGIVVRPLADVDLARSVRFVTHRDGAPPAVGPLLSALRREVRGRRSAAAVSHAVAPAGALS